MKQAIQSLAEIIRSSPLLCMVGVALVVILPGIVKLASMMPHAH